MATWGRYITRSAGVLSKSLTRWRQWRGERKGGPDAPRFSGQLGWKNRFLGRLVQLSSATVRGMKDPANAPWRPTRILSSRLSDLAWCVRDTAR